MVNLELYRVFYTVAKCGSLTKAAAELFISQPAVSQAIKQLESQLGGKLFNRVSRGMQLSESGGKQIFETVSKAINMLDDAEKQFSDLKTIASGTVRIGAADNVICYFLIKYIKEFREKYPNVTLSFTNCTSRECVELVKSDKVDIGFVNLPINYPGVVFTGQTGIIHDIFVASPKFSELHGREIPLNLLTNYPLLMLDNSTMTRKTIDEFTKGLSINFLPDFELGSVELLVAMAVNGMGVACVPREYVAKELEAGQLIEINTDPTLPTRAIGVITPTNESLSFAVNEFLTLLNKYEKTE